MLTKLTLRNFKRFESVDIELGNPVVFIGPNNSGKTTALQALALWETGLKRWNEKRGGEHAPRKRSGVAINRRDLIALPVPAAKLLWKNLHVRDSQVVNERQTTSNVCVEIVVEGVTANKSWTCGIEFDYANEESFYCRPLRLGGGKKSERMPIPKESLGINVAFLPPMSGLAANETRLDPGAVAVRVGEGRTAEVLRNLCYEVVNQNDENGQWNKLCEQIKQLFGVDLEKPLYVQERGEITMAYRESPSICLDLSCSGRGLQQTLLLLAYIYTHQNSVLVLDEPDAHLEILRQRQIYQLLTEMAGEHGCQVVAASHSEVLLNEAADRDVVVAFLGKPHRIDDRGKEVVKSLKEIGFEQDYQAEQKGWVLYLEGATDLAVLREFARKLGHKALEHLERPFVHYVLNQPNQARRHFHGLREAKPDLVGFALFDRIDKELVEQPGLKQCKWRKREIENYLCQPETLLAFAVHKSKEHSGGPLFEASEQTQWQTIMQQCIKDFALPAALRDRTDSWWNDMKASNEFLDRVFKAFYMHLRLQNLLRKTDYHVLAKFVPEDRLDPEISEVLDSLAETAQKAKPLVEEQLS